MEKAINTRPITAFAFLADKLSAGGDLFSGLIPLFAPITNPLAGNRFEANELSDLIANYYGMDIHPYAVEAIAPRLLAEGLLERTEISPNSYEYYYKKVETEFAEVEDNLVENVSGQFIKFAEEQFSLLGIRIDEKTLTNALLDRLKRAEFFSIFVKPSEPVSKNTLTLRPKSNDLVPAEKNHYEQRLDVLVASFLLSAHINNPDLYDLLIKITTGALIAEVILDFRHPDNLENLRGLQVVLDAPFLMALFDLGSKLGTAYAEKLYKQLQESGAKLNVFRHTIDEFKDNLKAVLDAKKAGRAYGATAIRLTDPNFKTYATTLLPVLESRITQKGIDIATEANATMYRFFTNDEENDLASRFVFHNSAQAMERDAHSIACIMRQRQGLQTPFANFQSCKSIFLTKNTSLASISEKELIRTGRIYTGEVPPCITDRYFAGLLWIMFGGEKDGLPEHLLLANCARAAKAGIGVISKMHDILVNFSPEQLEHFTALMTTERGSQYFAQITLDDPSLITNENWHDIYNKLELVVAEKVTKEKDAEISRIKEEHAKEKVRIELEEAAKQVEILNERESHEKSFVDKIKQKDNEIIEARTESFIHSRQAQLSKEELDKVRKEKDAIEFPIISDAVGKGVRRRKFLSLLIISLSIVFFVALNAIDKYYLSSLPSGSLLNRLSAPVYYILIALQFALSFWIVPEYFFGRYTRKKQLEVTESHLTKFGLSIINLEKYEIDWSSGSIKKGN